MAANPPSRPGTPNNRVNAGTQTDRSLSVFQALSQPLPALKTIQGWVERSDTHYSSTATEITHPPAFWQEVPIDDYIRKADQAMANSRTAVLYLQGHADPGPDPLARMRSEADVVRYGDEQLVFHVNHGLYACVGPDRIESYGEYEFDRCRPDKAWKRPSATSNKTLAVFESKIKATIKLNEFDRAKLRNGENPNAKIQAARDQNLEKESHFTGKSLKIMSQAAKYARNATFNTNYVALFDSDYLFLCVFDRTNAYAMRGTLVPCGQANARKALLGWLLTAYEDEAAGRNGRAPPHPGDSGHRNTRSSNTNTKSNAAPPPPGAGGAKPPSGSNATMPRSSSSAAAPPPRSGTNVATAAKTAAGASTAKLPTRTKRQKVDSKGRPMVDAKGNPIYE